MTDRVTKTKATSQAVTSGNPVQMQVALDWSDVESLPLFFATHFASNLLGPDGVVLMFGQAIPPTFPGTPDEQAAAIQNVKMISARPHSRILLSPAHLRELIAILQQSQRMLESIPIQATLEDGQQ